MGTDLTPSSAGVARDSNGKLLPGSKLGAAGKPKGRANDSTIEARRLMKRRAYRAVKTLVDLMSHSNPFVAMGAARIVLDGAMAAPPDPSMDDADIVDALTPQELEQVHAVYQRAKRRLGRGQDEFTLDSLPPPIDIEATTLTAPSHERYEPPAPPADPTHGNAHGPEDWVTDCPGCEDVGPAAEPTAQ